MTPGKLYRFHVEAIACRLSSPGCVDDAVVGANDVRALDVGQALRETAKQGRLVVLASGPGDALDRAQPIFDAIGSKTVRLEPEAGGASRMKLVATAWTVGLWESLRYQLSRAARWASRAGARAHSDRRR